VLRRAIEAISDIQFRNWSRYLILRVSGVYLVHSVSHLL
jgi:hypothetical protein